MPLKWRGTVWRRWLCEQKTKPPCLQEEADPRVWLEMDATAGPSYIRFGFTDPRLTTQGGLIVWPCFRRQVGLRAAHGEIALPQKHP